MRTGGLSLLHAQGWHTKGANGQLWVSGMFRIRARRGWLFYRVLFEVASLEREAALPHQACLRHLAASIRTCHKIHDFAGGFEQAQSELFDKAGHPST